MTQICVSLTDETTEGVLARMGELAPVADLFEIRGDLVLDLDLLTLLRAKPKPLLFTCRSEQEGGRWNDTETRRRMNLLEAVKRGFDYVDVEYRSEFLDVMIEKSGSGLIISYHDLSGMPEDLDGLYYRMCNKGADIVKIAVTPHGFADVARLLQFAEETFRGGGKPLIAIAMGPLGILFHPAGGTASRFFEVFGHLVIQIQQPLEVVGIAVRFIDNQRLFIDAFFTRIFTLFGLIGQRRVALLELQSRILDQFLLNAFLQLLERKLQDFHRLNHPRCKLLHLELSMFKAEG